MQSNQSKAEPITVQINPSISAQLIPNQEHEFFMSTKQMSEAYGVSEKNIHEHKSKREFVENIHFVTTSKNGSGSTANLGKKILWTKRGIIRMGFFIKSKQAEQVRQWAEDALFEKLENKPQQLALALTPVDNRSNLAYPPQYDRELVALLVRIPSQRDRTRLYNKLKKGGLL